ncbi:expressed unknown protein [Seminavis robusta]|uniref:Uncharacterized protein n=1 Tax=Seminavis robusta TaxID=568900 RepID=A0A9N8DKG2_9STRA|nr:expressed unknown protein [Seminavis robusta]|eukprot:Sro191_g082100.1 n/a (341) ;mRNA; f:13360-14382
MDRPSLFDFLWGACPDGNKKVASFLAISCSGRKLQDFSSGPFTLESLETRLDPLFTSEDDDGGTDHIDDLLIDGDDRWQNQSITDEEWTRLCDIVGKLCCRLRSVRIIDATVMSDERWAELLERMPSTLSKLVISGLGGDMPLTFEKVGALRGLEEFSLIACSSENYVKREDAASWLQYDRVWCTPDSFAMLAQSLKQACALKSIDISTTTLCNPQACWEPITEVIRTNPRLVTVTIPPQHYAYLLEATDRSGLSDWTLGNFADWEIKPRDLDALQNGPRICKARQQHNVPYQYQKKDLKRWVEAMIMVQDHLECFHYFFAHVPPEVYLFHHNPKFWEVD